MKNIDLSADSPEQREEGKKKLKVAVEKATKDAVVAKVIATGKAIQAGVIAP